MKKIYILLVAVILTLTLVCAAACESEELTEQINEALKKDYTSVTVNTVVKMESYTLNGVYNIRYDGDSATVEYTFDKFNTLDPNGDNSDSLISTVSGTASVVDGKIVGEDVDLNAGVLAYTGFSFKKNFLKVTNDSRTVLNAQVLNPKAFVGNNDFGGTDMTVSVICGGGILQKLAVEYTSVQGANVSVTYLFQTDSAN